MPDYSILTTENFEKEFKKLPSEIQQRFRKQFKRLKINPFGMGKPLKDRIHFRELKNDKYRAYYAIYPNEIIILLAGVSDKKQQQAEIDFIFNNLDKLAELVRNRKN